MDRLHDLFGDSLAIIRYHGWWPDGSDPFHLANVAEARDRINYLYQHQQNPNDGLYAPHFFVDMLFDADAEPGIYENRVRQALAVPSLIAMDVDLDLDFAGRQLTVNCAGQSEAAIPDALHLRCALTESDLMLPSASQFPFDQVMRDMFPTSAGIPIDLATTQTFTAQATASLDPSWELHNLEVVVFIQEDVEGEIFQTVKLGMPSDLPWFKLVSYDATETGGGDGDGVINPGEDGTIVAGILADPEWGAVSDVVLTLVSLSDLVTVTAGTASLPDMVPGDTVWVPAGQLGVTVSPQAGFGELPLELVLSGTFGAGDAYQQSIPIELVVSMFQPGFPFATAGEVLSSPAAFALPQSIGTGFGIAVGDEAGDVHVVNSHGQYLQGFPVQAGTRASSSPAVGDLNADGMPEIVIGSWDDHLYCFSIDGSTLWSVDLGGYVTGPAAIGDVDGDGAPEVVAGTMSGDLWVLEADGATAQGWPVALGTTQRVSAGVCLADLDGDGVREIVVGTWGKNVYAYNGDATPLPGWPVVLTKEVKTGVITTVVANHGLVVLVPCLDDMLHVLKPTGEEAAAVLFEGDLMSTPAVGDLNGDGTLEIIATTANGYVHALDYLLQELPGWPATVGARIESSPVLADLDGDDLPEIIIGADDNRLRIFGSDGSLVFQAMDLGARIRSTPALADFDEDNDIDLVVGAGLQVVGLDFKTQGGSVQGMWSQYRGTIARTGDYLDIGAVSGPQQPALPTAVSLHDVRPNPAARHVSVTMDLPVEGVARLAVFDLAGRCMGTAAHRQLGAGSHRVPVDVSGLSQGLYFLRLTTAQGNAQAPLVVLK